MKVVKGASGFGDAIYMRVIMEWLLKNRPDEYTILTKYPDVFSNLSIKTENFNSNHLKIDYNFTYIHNKTSSFSQFEDLIRYGNLSNITLTSDLKNRKLTNTILVINPYAPMNGGSMATEMKPNLEEYINFVSNYNNIQFINKKYKFKDLIDMFNSAKAVISQVGWAVPLAEMLDVPLIAIFTKRALNSKYQFISTIKPHKIKTKKTTIIKIME